MVVYYAYFRAWDITLTKELRLKIAKSSAELCGLLIGSSIVILIKPEILNLDPIFSRFLIKVLVVYLSSVWLFLYIHHFGLHPKPTNSV